MVERGVRVCRSRTPPASRAPAGKSEFLSGRPGSRPGCILRSSHLTRILFLLLAGNAAGALLAQARPDLSGVWKLQSTRARYSEVWTVKQTAGDIRIRMDITDDQLGDRVLDFEAPLDGKEHKQTVIGTPANVTAAWEDDTLFLEIKRQAGPGILLHTKRRMRLAGEGQRLESHTTQYSPPPVAERDEVFDRQ
jgi:hypothetical protein